MSNLEIDQTALTEADAASAANNDGIESAMKEKRMRIPLKMMKSSLTIMSRKNTKLRSKRLN